MVSQLNSGSVAAGVDLGRLRGLRDHLKSRIKGQDRVLDVVSTVLTRSELGLSHPRRSRGTFLFVGPTGVGKTETVNVFTRYLCDSTPLRFDLSEYQLQQSVDKLIGENRDDPGLLGRAVRNSTSGTLLFDEIEKAHPLILDLLLQILEDARITLATGEALDFQQFYIVSTSNIGSPEAIRMENAPPASVERTVLMRIREQLRPELVGRFQEILVFARLGYETQRAICEAMIQEESDRLLSLGHDLDVTPALVESILREGYHRTLGARPMRSAVERYLQTIVANNILAGHRE